MLAIFKIIFKIQRSALGGATKTLRKAKQYSNIVRFSQACCLCCIHMHMRLSRYISKHLLVQMCIWGDSFLPASQKAYFLLSRHQDKVNSLDTITTFILLQTKVNSYKYFTIILIGFLCFVGWSLCICLSNLIWQNSFWKKLSRPRK